MGASGRAQPSAHPPGCVREALHCSGKRGREGPELRRSASEARRLWTKRERRHGEKAFASGRLQGESESRGIITEARGARWGARLRGRTWTDAVIPTAGLLITGNRRRDKVRGLGSVPVVRARARGGV